MSDSEADSSQTRAAKRLKMTAHSSQSDADDSELPTLSEGSPGPSTTACSAAGTIAAAGATTPDSHARAKDKGKGKAETGWPALEIPVEIFDLIVAHLSRKDVQNMRLVNHEFDAKLAGSYFKTVVVPFRPEFEALYGSLNINPGRKGSQQKWSLVRKGKKVEAEDAMEEDKQDPANTTDDDASLLSDGYRVFEQFGKSCMRKFALALELNEKDLAFPPLKVNQEIVMAPWGLYRWPIMRYQRYHQLENLEQMADETGFMKKAFAFLEKVTHIGISCDPGLGWLQGPDTNVYCTGVQPPVFRPASHGADEDDDDDPAPEQEDNESLSLTILKQMALNAGYDSDEWPRVILRLLEDEGRAVQWREHVAADGKITHERVPIFAVDDDTTKEDIIRHIEELIEGECGEAQLPNARVIGLQPSALTPAQAEMLLELEWAHRALMQSYRTAVLDNRLSFMNLTNLTIARCPSCHVSIWCDRSFWTSMTSIKSFHLGVIPGWREIVKDSFGYVMQRRVSPIHAVAEVFTLLQEYVGPQENIKEISFEWVNGGEFAVGKSQRDRYILPAPVVSNPDKMVDMQPFGRQDVVSLPHISKLSLKNCWFSPHVFYNFIKSLFLDNVTDLVLESVSLTGAPCASPPALGITPITQRLHHWPWPLCVGAEPGTWFKLYAPNAIQNMNPGPAWVGLFGGGWPNLHLNFPNAGGAAAQQLGHHGPAAISTSTLAQHPVAATQQDNRWRAWSWPWIFASLGVLPEYVHDDDEFSAANLPEYHAIRSVPKPFSSDFQEVLLGRERADLPRTIRLKSCGYALIESTNIDNWKIIPDHPVYVHHDEDLPARLKELDSQMLTSDHPLLGKVLHYLPDDEELVLQNPFGLRFGWVDLYSTMLIRAAVEDGVLEPGKARFHGNLSTKPRRAGTSTASQERQVARL